MTHVSRRKLDESASDLFKDALTELFTNLSPQEVDKVLSTLVTKTEISMFKKRLAVVILLAEGLTVDQVSKITKTTRQTVMRLRYQLDKVNPTNKSFVQEKMKKWINYKLIKSFLKNAPDLLPTRAKFRKKISKI